MTLLCAKLPARQTFFAQHLLVVVVERLFVKKLSIRRQIRSWLLLSLSAFALMATVTCFGASSTSLEKSERSPVIMVLGDSISAAYGISTENGWVHLLDQHLQDQYPQTRSRSDTSNSGAPNTGVTQQFPAYRVINASISGETTGGALTRLPALLERHQPGIVIIELGGNDGLRGFPIPRFQQNLEQLVRLSQQAGAKVLITGMRIPPNYGNRYTKLFYDSYAKTAQNFNVPLVPFLLENIATDPDLMQADGIHPTAEAQPRILQNVLPHLKKML